MLENGFYWVKTGTEDWNIGELAGPRLHLVGTVGTGASVRRQDIPEEWVFLGPITEPKEVNSLGLRQSAGERTDLRFEFEGLFVTGRFISDKCPTCGQVKP